MPEQDERIDPVKAKTFLVDPSSMTVVWMNESAFSAVASDGSEDPPSISEVAAATGLSSGVLEAVQTVYESGEPRHLRAALVSTSKGRLTIATSIYRLPGGQILLLVEHAWQVGHGSEAEDSPRRSGRRGR